MIRALYRDGRIGGFDTVSAKKNGDIVFRKGYFYRNGVDEVKFRDIVSNGLRSYGIDFEVVDYGDHWAPFKGGKGVPQNSHFYVVIK